MNRSETLNLASMRLFIAKHCGGRSPAAKDRDVQVARHDLVRTVRAWRAIGCATHQREAINRRQRRAQCDGVELWRRGVICGMEFAQRKW